MDPGPPPSPKAAVIAGHAVEMYLDLRRLAGSLMRNERACTLQPTALVHESFLRMHRQDLVEWNDRMQFFAIAAQMMRRILVDHARRRATLKRGKGTDTIALDSGLDIAGPSVLEILEVDNLLEKLGSWDPSLARIVELRFFAGLSLEETASALNLSPAKVRREWTTARAWLHTQMTNPRNA